MVVTHELASILTIADRCIMLDRHAFPDAGGVIASAIRAGSAPRAPTHGARVLSPRTAGRRSGVMEGRAASVRVGLLIVGGIVVILALVWFLRGADVSHGDADRNLFRRIGAGFGGRIAGAISRRDGRARDRARRGQRRIRQRHATLPSRCCAQVYVRYLVDTSRIGRFPSVAEAVQALGLRARLGTRLITGLSYIDLDFVEPDLVSGADPSVEPLARVRSVGPERVRAGAECRPAGAGEARQGRLRRADRSVTGLSDDLRAELDSGDLHKTLTAAQNAAGDLEPAVKAADLPAVGQPGKNIRRASGVADEPGSGEAAARRRARRPGIWPS